jgi:hypothetical protein
MDRNKGTSPTAHRRLIDELDTRKLVQDLIYANYRFQRQRTKPERLSKIFPDADKLEKKYQDELSSLSE